MTRKFLLFVSVILLLLLLPSAALAQDFSDLPEGPYGAVLQKAADNGLLTGANGKIMPGGELTRAQMAAVISRAFGAAEKADISSFVDVKQAAWYYQYLQTAVKMGVLKGDGNKLNPLSAISREEAFTVIARALKLDEAQTAKRQFADLSEASAWAKGSVYALINNGYVNGDGKNLHLKSSITRAEFATIFDNIIKTYASKAGTYTAAGAGNFMINCDKVTLKDLTVNGDLIIGDGVAAGDVTLDNVTVTGRVVVRGGGQNSLHIINKSKIGTLILSKTASGAVRVVTENGAQIEFVYINDGKDDVILEGSFDNVELNSNIPLIAQNAQVNELQLNAPSASVSLTAGSSIQNFNISEQAAGSSLSVGAGTSVSNVNSTAANVQIAGSGTVTNAQISGNNTKVDTKGTALTVSQGTTGVTNNGQSVSSGTTVTVPPVTGGGGGGGSSSYIAKVSSEAELLAALNNSNASSVQINNNIELTADLTISKPVDVLTGKTLTVAAGKTLTLKADLKIIGTLENNGSIIVAGKTALAANGGIFVTGGILTNNIGAAITLKKAEAEQAGFRVASGMMIAEDNGQISNYGTITSEADVNSPEWRPGGFFSVERGSSFDNFGTLNINGLDFQLGSDDLAGTLTNKAGGTVNLAAKININGKGFLVNEGTFNLNTNGDIIVHNILRADPAQDSKGTLTQTAPISVNGGIITRNANAYSEARLREALSQTDPFAYNNISCLSTVTLKADLTVPAGKALLIEDDNTNDQTFVTFTVPTDFTLTVDGQLYVSFADLISLDNGTVTVDTGGELNIYEGGRFYSQGYFNNNGKLEIIGRAFFIPQEGIDFADQHRSFVNNSSIEVRNLLELGGCDVVNAASGTITVYNGGTLGDYMSDIANSGTININNGGKLELDRGGQLHNSNAINVAGQLLVTGNGGNLQNTAGGIITVAADGVFNSHGVCLNLGTININGILNAKPQNEKDIEASLPDPDHPGDFYLRRVVNNEGIINVAGALHLGLTTLNNKTTGSIVIANGGSLLKVGDLYTITNNGTITISADASDFVFDCTNFTGNAVIDNRQP